MSEIFLKILQEHTTHISFQSQQHVFLIQSRVKSKMHNMTFQSVGSGRNQLRVENWRWALEFPAQFSDLDRQGENGAKRQPVKL